MVLPEKILNSEPYLTTNTGESVFPVHPNPEDFNLEDISHALSMTCRYNGHTNRFYSVAQHSMLIAEKASLMAKPYALMHDAAEAYTGDIARPLKHYLSDIVDIEHNILQVIIDVFGIPMSKEIKEEVKDLDNAILKYECDELFGKRKPNTEGIIIKDLGKFEIQEEVPLQFKKVFIDSFDACIKECKNANPTTKRKNI